MVQWYLNRGHRRRTVARPEPRRSTETFIPIDKEINRIAQLVEEARAELAEAHWAPDRRIAVSMGSISKLRRQCLPDPSHPLNPMSHCEGAQTARAHVPHSSMDLTGLLNSPLPPLTARPGNSKLGRSGRPSVRTECGTPPSREGPLVGETVRRHLAGEVYGCWQDLLDECHAASADGMSAVRLVDQTVQNMIREDSEIISNTQGLVAPRYLQIEWACKRIQAVMVACHARKQLRAREALDSQRKFSRSQDFSFLEASLPEYSNTSVVLSRDELGVLDRIPEWRDCWNALKQANCPEPESLLRPPKRLSIASITEMMEHCDELLADPGQSRQVRSLVIGLRGALSKTNNAVGLLCDSEGTEIRELALEAFLKPLDNDNIPAVQELVQVVKKARMMIRVFDDPTEEQHRMMACEGAVMAYLGELRTGRKLKRAADISVALEQLVLEKEKVAVSSLTHRTHHAFTELIQELHNNSYDCSQLSKYKHLLSTVMTDEVRQAHKLVSRQDQLSETQVQLVHLNQKLFGVNESLKQSTQLQGWPSPTRLAHTLTHCARLICEFRTHGFKQIATPEGPVLDRIFTAVMTHTSSSVSQLEQLRVQLEMQIIELQQLLHWDLTVMAVRVLRGLHEVLYCKSITQYLDQATNLVDKACGVLFLDSAFDEASRVMTQLQAKLESMYQDWKITCLPTRPAGTGLKRECCVECIEVLEEVLTIGKASASVKVSRQIRALEIHKGVGIMRKAAAAMEMVEESILGFKHTIGIANMIAGHLEDSLAGAGGHHDGGSKLCSEQAELIECRKLLLSKHNTHLTLQMVAVRLRLLQQALHTKGHDIAASIAHTLHTLVLNLCHDVLASAHRAVLEDAQRHVAGAIESMVSETSYLDSCKECHDSALPDREVSKAHQALYTGICTFRSYNCVLLSHQLLPKLTEVLLIGQRLSMRHESDGFTSKACKLWGMLTPLLGVLNQPLLVGHVQTVFQTVAAALRSFVAELIRNNQILYGDYKDAIGRMVGLLQELGEQEQDAAPSEPMVDDSRGELGDLMEELVAALYEDTRVASAMKCKRIHVGADLNLNTIVELAHEVVAVRSLGGGQKEKLGEGSEEGGGDEEGKSQWDEVKVCSSNVLDKYQRYVSTLRTSLQEQDSRTCCMLRAEHLQSLCSVLTSICDIVKTYQAVDSTPKDDKTLMFASYRMVRDRHLACLQKELISPIRRGNPPDVSPKSKPTHSISSILQPTALVAAPAAGVHLPCTSDDDEAPPKKSSPSQRKKTKSTTRLKAVFDPHGHLTVPVSSSPGWLYDKKKFKTLSMNQGRATVEQDREGVDTGSRRPAAIRIPSRVRDTWLR